MVWKSVLALVTFTYTTCGSFSHAVTMQAADKHFIPCACLLISLWSVSPAAGWLSELIPKSVYNKTC